MSHEARILDAVQQHVGDAEHVGKLLLLNGAQRCLHDLLVLGPLHIAFAHVAQRTGEEAAGAAGGVEQGLAGLRVDTVGHEGGDGARRVILAGVACRLQVVEDLFVDVAEMLAFGQVVEIDLVDLVDHLAHQLAGFHVVVGVLEHVADDAAAVAGLTGHRQVLQGRKQVVIYEGHQCIARDALGVRRPGSPLIRFRDRRGVIVAHQHQFLILIVDNLEEEHPAQLTDTLGVAVDTGVLAHDVLDGFDEGADGHGSGGLLVQGGLKFVDGSDETVAPAERPDQLNRGAQFREGRDAQDGGVVEVEHALVGVFGQQGIKHGAGLVAILGEHVPLLDLFGPLAPGQRFGVKGDVADQVEGVEVLAQFSGDDVERQTLGRQFLDDGLFAFGSASSA